MEVQHFSLLSWPRGEPASRMEHRLFAYEAVCWLDGQISVEWQQTSAKNNTNLASLASSLTTQMFHFREVTAALICFSEGG